jgi:hypothetical protein
MGWSVTAEKISLVNSGKPRDAKVCVALTRDPSVRYLQSLVKREETCAA